MILAFQNPQRRSDNTISIDDEQSSSLIKGVYCGVIKPGVVVAKTLHLLSHDTAGDRVLDISVQTRIPGSSSSDQDDSEGDVTENLQTVSIPTVDAFHLTQDVTYQHNEREWTVLTDLRSYEEDYEEYERGIEATIVTDISIVGPWSIYIECIKFDNEVGQSDFDATIITWGKTGCSCKMFRYVVKLGR